MSTATAHNVECNVTLTHIHPFTNCPAAASKQVSLGVAFWTSVLAKVFVVLAKVLLPTRTLANTDAL